MKLHPKVTNKKSIESFQTLEERFRKVHGDLYKYNKTIYKNNTFKIEILCKKHKKSFWQTPISHLGGAGCPLCAKDKKTLSQKEFIKRAKKVHENKYKYTKVEYKTLNHKVIIICPIHGDFIQKPDTHLQGSGCPACTGQAPISNDEFIDKAKGVHGNRYNYSKSKYKNATTKVEIICYEHSSFFQIPRVHINGSGCPQCNKGGRKSKNI